LGGLCQAGETDGEKPRVVPHGQMKGLVSGLENLCATNRLVIGEQCCRKGRRELLKKWNVIQQCALAVK